MRTSTKTLIDAMYVLADEVQSGDGVANIAIAEAAGRLKCLHSLLENFTGLTDDELDDYIQHHEDDIS